MSPRDIADGFRRLAEACDPIIVSVCRGEVAESAERVEARRKAEELYCSLVRAALRKSDR